MRILYVGYWPSGDSLSRSVIKPRLEFLSAHRGVEKIYYCSVERQEGSREVYPINKVNHIYFQSKKIGGLLFTKFFDFYDLNKELQLTVDRESITHVICNGPLAGIIGYYLFRTKKTSFVVECFEPHADYMREGGTWSSWDPRYLILKYYEGLQKKYAWKLIALSSHYITRLILEGVPSERMMLLPSCIPVSKFRFLEVHRNEIRECYNIPFQSVVGIYVGKFGDIYYDEEAFDLFKKAFTFFGNEFWIIILTGHDQSEVIRKLDERNIDLVRVVSLSVPYEQVHKYLSSADFAFSTIKPSANRIYCSPIKNGEYWANGLPVLTEDGIGEDSEIIRREGGGIILDMLHPEPSFQKLLDLIAKGRQTNAMSIEMISFRHRRMELMQEYYTKLLAEWKG